MTFWDLDGLTPASRPRTKYPLGFAHFAVYFAGLTWRTSRSRGASCCSSPGRPTGRSRRRWPSTWGSRCVRSEEHTSELQSRQYLVCRLLLEKKKPRDGGFEALSIFHVSF